MMYKLTKGFKPLVSCRSNAEMNIGIAKSFTLRDIEIFLLLNNKQEEELCDATKLIVVLELTK